MIASEEPMQEVPMAFSSSLWVAEEKLGQKFIAYSVGGFEVGLW
jgi:hypothetical protein